MSHEADARTARCVWSDVYGVFRVLRHRKHRQERQGKGKVGTVRTVQVEHLGQEQGVLDSLQFVLLFSALLYLL